MIKSSIERVARNRYGMPIILALALIMVVVNESSYQHSRSTLAQGITLSDARQKAARTLQAEVKPLGKRRRHVRPQTQLDIEGISQADDFNGASIELAGNRDGGHGQGFPESGRVNILTYGWRRSWLCVNRTGRHCITRTIRHITLFAQCIQHKNGLKDCLL